MNMSMLRVASTNNSIQIFRGNEIEPILVQQTQPNSRPYIHPLVAPDGKGILTENAPSHHPWQHGIYVGLNDINGVGFWEESLRGNSTDGSFHPKALKDAIVDLNQVFWEVETEWRDPQGSAMLSEIQQWRLQDKGATYVIDLQWTLCAKIDLVFGRYDYGGLFLRMPYRTEWGGEALNSEGLMNQEAEGQRARWVACSMPIEGREGAAGIAFMDHPDNIEHPVPWRVDGELGICPSPCIAIEQKLKKGEALTNRYRVVAFSGTADKQLLNESWEDFSRL